MAEFVAFEIRECGKQLVVVFEHSTGMILATTGDDGSPVFIGIKEAIFDEELLAKRVRELQERGADAEIEEWALGDLRKARMMRDLAERPDDKWTGSRQAAEEDWIFGNRG